MNLQPVPSFTWLSPLGISVTLFLLINLIYLLFGLASPVLFRLIGPRLTEQFGLVFSPRSDLQAFGRTPLQIIEDQPTVMVTRVVIYDMLAGLYLAVAILHFCLVWFGLRYGYNWALWALTLSNLAVILFYLLAARTFSSELTPLNLSDLAPYALLPGIILPLAAVLGWIGLR